MATERILFPEFRDEQKESRYPFVDQATLRDESNSVAIENSAFIDAAFFAINSAAQLYLSQISTTAQTVTVYVGTEEEPTKLSATYDAGTGPTNSVIQFLDAYGRPGGILLSNPVNLSKFNSWLPGDYFFSPAATEFVSSVVVPVNAPGVRGIIFENNFIYGDMWLIGDAGVTIRKEVDTDRTIRIDVIGEPLFARFVCEPIADFPTTPYLKTINGCGPDNFGNFTITATNYSTKDPVLRVTPKDNVLIISSVGRSLNNA